MEKWWRGSVKNLGNWRRRLPRSDGKCSVTEHSSKYLFGSIYWRDIHFFYLYFLQLSIFGFMCPFLLNFKCLIGTIEMIYLLSMTCVSSLSSRRNKAYKADRIIQKRPLFILFSLELSFPHHEIFLHFISSSFYSTYHLPTTTSTVTISQLLWRISWNQPWLSPGSQPASSVPSNESLRSNNWTKKSNSKTSRWNGLSNATRMWMSLWKKWWKKEERSCRILEKYRRTWIWDQMYFWEVEKSCGIGEDKHDNWNEKDMISGDF